MNYSISFTAGALLSQHILSVIALLKQGQRLSKALMECEEYNLYLKGKIDQQIKFDLDDRVMENYEKLDGVVGKVK